MEKTHISAEHLRLLESVDSPTIANVIELFDIRPRSCGYTGGAIKAVYPNLKPAVGYAVTATFRSAYPAAKGDVYGSTPRVLTAGETIPAPRIMVIEDLDEHPAAAVYGELMAASFKRFEYRALITNGAGRDFEQVEKLNFPCFVSSMIVSHGYCRILDVNTPVNIAGLSVTPGMLLHADGNGIIEIPLSIAAAVAELAQPFVAAEQILLDYLREPKPTLKGYDAAIAKMRDALNDLRARAQRSPG